MSNDIIKGRTPYAEDGLKLDGNTSIDEVLAFTERRTKNPMQINGVTIWNFSSHEIDLEALENAAHNKLNRGRYVIPFQVTGTWPFIYNLLPQDLQEAEVLIYHQRSASYRAYDNYFRQLPTEVRDEFQKSLANYIHNQGYLEE